MKQRNSGDFQSWPDG